MGNLHNSRDPKGPKIAIIGGGFGGICAAVQLEKQLGICDYTIYDENSNFGGTWLVNTYPGCQCDIESHLYSFSFEQNPNWTRNYASQSEILEYIHNIGRKYDLYSKVKFMTQVTALEWHAGEAKWRVSILDKNSNTPHTLLYDYTIIAVGALRVPLIPPEFAHFKGPLIHSAQWDDKIDLRDKRVAVIGGGASAIQIIPEIAPIVKELHCYQRKPAWVEPRAQFEFPAIIKKLFNVLPPLLWLFRLFLFVLHECYFGAFKVKTVKNYLGKRVSEIYLKSQILEKSLQMELTPNYQFGCKRVLVSENYFATFNSPQVILHREAIQKVTANSLMTVKGEEQIDVLILATGFRVQELFAPMKIIGRYGANLEEWSLKGPRTYFGVMSSVLPNAFFLLGPNTALGHTSILFMIECQVNFTIQVIRESLKKRARGVIVRKKVEDEFMEGLERDMKGTVWGAFSCGSWYANARGVITSLWPKSCVSYYKETRRLNVKILESIE